MPVGDRSTAIEFWPFPAGFMEIGEATEAVAIRETKVEALADVAILSFLAVPSMPNIASSVLTNPTPFLKRAEPHGD